MSILGLQFDEFWQMCQPPIKFPSFKKFLEICTFVVNFDMLSITKTALPIVELTRNELYYLSSITVCICSLFAFTAERHISCVGRTQFVYPFTINTWVVFRFGILGINQIWTCMNNIFYSNILWVKFEELNSCIIWKIHISPQKTLFPTKNVKHLWDQA